MQRRRKQSPPRHGWPGAIRSGSGSPAATGRGLFRNKPLQHAGLLEQPRLTIKLEMANPSDRYKEPTHYLSAMPANKPAMADNGVQTFDAIVSLTFASPCQITP